MLPCVILAFASSWFYPSCLGELIRVTAPRSTVSWGNLYATTISRTEYLPIGKFSNEFRFGHEDWRIITDNRNQHQVQDQEKNDFPDSIIIGNSTKVTKIPTRSFADLFSRLSDYNPIHRMDWCAIHKVISDGSQIGEQKFNCENIRSDFARIRDKIYEFWYYLESMFECIHVRHADITVIDGEPSGITNCDGQNLAGVTVFSREISDGSPLEGTIHYERPDRLGLVLLCWDVFRSVEFLEGETGNASYNPTWIYANGSHVKSLQSRELYDSKLTNNYKLQCEPALIDASQVIRIVGNPKRIYFPTTIVTGSSQREVWLDVISSIPDGETSNAIDYQKDGCLKLQNCRYHDLKSYNSINGGNDPDPDVKKYLHSSTHDLGCRIEKNLTIDGGPLRTPIINSCYNYGFCASTEPVGVLDAIRTSNVLGNREWTVHTEGGRIPLDRFNVFGPIVRNLAHFTCSTRNISVDILEQEVEELWRPVISTLTNSGFSEVERGVYTKIDKCNPNCYQWYRQYNGSPPNKYIENTTISSVTTVGYITNDVGEDGSSILLIIVCLGFVCSLIGVLSDLGYWIRVCSSSCEGISCKGCSDCRSKENSMETKVSIENLSPSNV